MKHLIQILMPMLILVVMIMSCSSGDAPQDPEFVKAEMDWRETRDQSLRKPTSWLTIAGLHWLEEGENTFGTAEHHPVRLPEGSAPADCGKFTLKDGQVKFTAARGVDFKIGDEIVRKRDLKGDDTREQDVLEINALKMWVIKREDRIAIRLRDQNAKRFQEYSGLKFFPPKEKFKLVADFVAYPELKKQLISSVVGTKSEMTIPGYLKFELDGKEYQLDVFGSSPDAERFFIVMKDGTSGDETYGASRFMSATKLENNKVDLNFNRAYNPPCAYTPYATCPLPPPQNILTVRIEAGEMMYGEPH